MAATSGDRSGIGDSVGCASREESASSTPFVSASSSPDHDPSFSATIVGSVPSTPARDASFSAAGCFYSAPASPARAGGGVPGAAGEYGCELGFDFHLDFDFDFSSCCPSPAVAAMSSADELFHNGQIRPMRLPSFLIRQQALPPLDGDVVVDPPPPPQPSSEPAPPAGADERGRLRNRSVHRRHRSLSPFRSRWLSRSSSPAPAAATSVEPAAASRSSSSSSTESSASSSSSSRGYFRKWGFLKGIFHRSKSDGGERPPLCSNPSPLVVPKRSLFLSSPAAAVASRGRGKARRSAHSRLYEARRAAEAEEMRRRTFLPYGHSVLLGFLGFGSRGYGAMHGLAAATGKTRS